MSAFLEIFGIPRRKKKLPPVEDPPIEIPQDPIATSLIKQVTSSGLIGARGYSYWSSISNHISNPFIHILVSVDGQLTIFMINKKSLDIIAEEELHINHTGEGCFFSSLYPSDLYYVVGNQLRCFNISNRIEREIFSLNQDEVLWQVHGNSSDSRFSGTIKDGFDYSVRGWVVHSIHGETQRFDTHNEPDECQIDKSGDWFVIKESRVDGDRRKLDNRIINLISGASRIVLDEEGATGHSDCGFNCIIGEDDMSSHAGALVLFDFASMLDRKLIFSTGVWNMGHVSFCNALPGSLADQKCLLTEPSGDVSLVKLDGSQRRLKLFNTQDEEINGDDRAKPCLDHTGQFIAFTAKRNGRRDAFIARAPEWQ